MIHRGARATAHRRRFIGFLTVAIAVSMFVPPTPAEERKLIIMLGVPRKSIPGNPIQYYQTLANPNDIWDQYFDRVKPNVDSFAEYFNEISYGETTVSGDVYGWVDIPWPALPTVIPDGTTSLDGLRLPIIDLNSNGLLDQFQGEAFTDAEQMILIDYNGALLGTGTADDPTILENLPTEGFGVGVGADPPEGWWTPGERFRDLNSNGRYDALLEPTRDGWKGDFDENAATCDLDGIIENDEICADFDDDGEWDFPEPFEDFIRVWNPAARWVRLDPSYKNMNEGSPTTVGSRLWAEAYIRRNYPGDAGQPLTEAGDKNASGFMARFGNDRYDGPDRWTEVGNAKLQQYPSPNTWLLTATTPNPDRSCAGGDNDGMYCGDDPGICDEGDGSCVQNTLFEWSYTEWWREYWRDAHLLRALLEPEQIQPYAPAPPAWPDNDRIPDMRDFNPQDPNPTPVSPDLDIPFTPNSGGTNARVGSLCVPSAADEMDDCVTDALVPPDPPSPGNGFVDDENSGVGSGNNVLPDKLDTNLDGQFDYYDGPAEFDDLPSSIYHAQSKSGLGYGGEGRLGEVTSTLGDDPWGQDIGTGNPQDSGSAGPDGVIPPAGPLAFGVHGTNGYDAGNVLTLEWLTWAHQGPEVYAIDFSTTPDCAHDGDPSDCVGDEEGLPECMQDGDASDCDRLHGILKRDFNLDGLLDLGEVREPDTENYAYDANPNTPNNGGPGSEYPFNRRRLTEDVVAALDPSVDWDQVIAPFTFDGFDIFGDPFTFTINFGFGSVLIPGDLYADGLAAGGRGLFQLPAPAMDLPIQINEPGVNPRRQIFFSDFVTAIGGTNETGQISQSFEKELMAHEYLHVWEGYPDLYDYDVYIGGFENCPVAAWDIMAGGGFVHPSPFLKEASTGSFYDHSPWIKATDLSTVLQPLTETTVSLGDYAFDPINSVFYFVNPLNDGERFYFWYVTDRIVSNEINFSRNLPGEGVLIMHTDLGQNPEGIPLQNRIGSHFTYNIIQADGLQQLDPCANNGDASDPFPGSAGVTTWTETSDPNSRWWGQVRSGLEITNVTLAGDQANITFLWEPRVVPQMKIINPPGGIVGAGGYQLRYEAFDFAGGTNFEFYFDDDAEGYDGTLITPIVNKEVPGFIEGSFDVPLNQLPGDGTYRFYARLVPGPGEDDVVDPLASEPTLTLASRSRGHMTDESTVCIGGENAGAPCEIEVLSCGTGVCGFSSDTVAVDLSTSLLESWRVTCVDDTIAGAEEWQVVGSLSGTQSTNAITGETFTADNNQVSFNIQWDGIEGDSGAANVSDTNGAFSLVDPTAAFVATNFEFRDVVRIIDGPNPGFYTITSVPNPTTLLLDRDPGNSDGTGGVTYRVHSFSVGDDDAAPDAFVFLTTGKTAYSAPVNIVQSQVLPVLQTEIVITYPNDATNPERRVPLLVQLDATGTLDEFGLVNPDLQFDWDFGDNSVIMQEPPVTEPVQHTYTINSFPEDTTFPVNVTVTLTATNTITGVSTEDTITFPVSGPIEDSDGDGVPNDDDNCPNASNPLNATATDCNGDGDTTDPNEAAGAQCDVDNDGLGNPCDNDDDGDTVPDATDNCPLIPNANQSDADADTIGDACDSVNFLDADGDTVPDSTDNCPNNPNAGQQDSDNDGVGNACDNDSPSGGSNDADGDTVPDATDNCPNNANAGQQDSDDDGTGDACDSDVTPGNDADGDTIPDTQDNCPTVSNASQIDADNDGLGDACETPEATGSTATGMVNANGFAALAVVTPDGLGSGVVRITRGTSGSTITVAINENINAPGNQDRTFNGFLDERAVRMTLSVTSSVSSLGTRCVIEFTVPQSLVRALGLDLNDVDLHVQSTDENGDPIWVVAADNYVGASMPTGVLGDYGYATNAEDGAITYWAERNSLSEFAIGQSLAGPSVISECDSNIDCDDGVFCNGRETCSDRGLCESGTNPCAAGGSVCDEELDECVDCLSSDECDDGLFCNGIESCNAFTGRCVLGLPPCDVDEVCDEETDACGAGSEDGGEEPPTGQPTPGPECGAGGGPCGTMGMLSLALMGLGLTTLRRRLYSEFNQSVATAPSPSRDREGADSNTAATPSSKPY